jgi:hypothetical protein
MARRRSQRLKKGSINQRIRFRLGSGWIHHSSHIEVELWTLGIGLSDTRVELLGMGCVRTIDGVGQYGEVVVLGGMRICDEEIRQSVSCSIRLPNTSGVVDRRRKWPGEGDKKAACSGLNRV